ncbi:MAG: phosphotransferase [Sedimentisphaerales bacterium]|nr:phosphotransferase [Sedimentisphaerales bacterium]
MTEFSYQSFKDSIFSEKQAESYSFCKLKKHLRTSKKHLRIKTDDYIAELDRDFCAGAKPHDFIEQVDMLMDSGEVIKKGDAVYVSHISWNNKNIVVKRYDHKGFIHSLRHTIKKSRARKGWLYAHFLGALNIATPRALAYIEQRKGLLVWQSYLVTEYVEGQKLWHFLRDDDVTEQQKLEEIRQVVKLLDRLWDFRITHGDLKHVNILITDNGPVLLDLDGMIVHRWELLYRNKRAKDMERFIRKTSLSPALNNYCRLLISSRKDIGKKLPVDFVKMRMDNWVISIHKNFPIHEIGNIVSENDSVTEAQDQFIRVPSSDFTRIVKCSFSFEGAERPLYLKKYLCRSVSDFIKHLFRPSRAKRAFNATVMLQNNGFDTPAVIGLFEHRTGPFCTSNLLLTEEIENSKPMSQVLIDFCRNSGRDAFGHKRDLIESFGRIIGQMHAKGIFHGDLRLGNVLVVREGQKWRFFFIDNERTKMFHRLPDRLRLKNLVQINMFRSGITNNDRLRFFKAYLENNPAIANNRQGWITKILKKTSRRLQNKYRRQ